jgi:anti-sigma-K factor RskA
VLVPALAAAAAAAVALGVWGAGVSDSLDRERAARRADAGALAAFSDPAATRTAAGNAALAVAGGRGALSLAKLAPAPAGKVYEAWVIPPGKAPIPAGLFDTRGGRAVIVLEPTVEPGATVAITLEPAGGVATPTGKPLVAVETSLS